MSASKPDEPRAVTDSLDTYRFTIDKSKMRVRFENETGEGRDDGEVTIIIEPVAAEGGIQ